MDIFKLNSNGEICIIQENCTNITAETIIIPSSLNGVKVTKFAKDAFFIKDIQSEETINVFQNVKKIIIEDGIEEINDFTFFNCKELEEIILPPSLMQIGTMAFSGTEKLKKLLIPSQIISSSQLLFDAFSSWFLEEIEFTGIGEFDIEMFSFIDCPKLIFRENSKIYNCANYWYWDSKRLFYRKQDGSLKEIKTAIEKCNGSRNINPNCKKFIITNKRRCASAAFYMCRECREKEKQIREEELIKNNISYRIKEDIVFKQYISAQELCEFLVYQNNELINPQKIIGHTLLFLLCHDLLIDVDKAFSDEEFMMQEEYFKALDKHFGELKNVIQNTVFNNASVIHVRKTFASKNRKEHIVDFQNSFAVCKAKNRIKYPYKSTTPLQTDNSFYEELFESSNGRKCYALKIFSTKKPQEEPTWFENMVSSQEDFIIQLTEVTFREDEKNFHHVKRKYII